ncbi:MAG: VTT domain-containing protein [Chthonomonadaceae bacterium]|nr:VTT domain-containing protein [Chthonomonadaceae bacterium]
MPEPTIFEVVLHLDKHLGGIIAQYQGWTYAILGGCIFLETGLVICPFLPGDTLLLAAGLFANPDKKQLSIGLLLTILPIASILGDNCNFWIGRFFGRFLFRNPNSKIFKPSYLAKAKDFYHRHGGKAVILGKFLAVVRTVVPFVAGMEAMPYAKFFPLTVISAIVWTYSCTLVGFFLGQIPIVRDNFEKLILGVLVLTVVLIVIEAIKHKREARRLEHDKLAQTEPT